MLELSGVEEFELAPEALWRSLATPSFLCQCFPGVDRVVHTDDRSASFVVRPGFSFVRGTLDVSLNITESDPNRSARLEIQVRGIGSSATLEAQMAIDASGTTTRVTWSARSLEIGGLLKAVSHGLLQAAAQKVAAETWTKIHAQLGQSSA